jgi:hypothetical protein
MCFSVSNCAGISRIVLAARKTEEMVAKGYYEGMMSTQEVNQLNNRKIEIDYVFDLEKESLVSDRASRLRYMSVATRKSVCYGTHLPEDAIRY